MTEHSFELAKLNALCWGNLQSDAPPICPMHRFRASPWAAVDHDPICLVAPQAIFYIALGDFQVKE